MRQRQYSIQEAWKFFSWFQSLCQRQQSSRVGFVTGRKVSVIALQMVLMSTSPSALLENRSQNFLSSNRLGTRFYKSTELELERSVKLYMTCLLPRYWALTVNGQQLTSTSRMLKIYSQVLWKMKWLIHLLEISKRNFQRLGIPYSDAQPQHVCTISERRRSGRRSGWKC